MKRIKQVFSSSSQVYHLWANQSQDHARQGGRITRAYFRGKSAYSYGSHYEVGRIMEYKGIKIALVNNRGYSHTTSKHISEAYSALDGLMLRLYTDGSFNVFKALVDWQDRIIDGAMSMLNQRKFWSDYSLRDFKAYRLDDLNEFNNTCKTLGHPELFLEFGDDLIGIILDHTKACKLRSLELNSPENLLKKQEKALKKNADAIKAWRSGEYNGYNTFLRSLKPQLLRVKGSQVETSGGAHVPLNEALQLLNLLENKKVKKGAPIGSFRYENVTDGIVKIGCHLIHIDEARNVLKPNGVWYTEFNTSLKKG